VGAEFALGTASVLSAGSLCGFTLGSTMQPPAIRWNVISSGSTPSTGSSTITDRLTKHERDLAIHARALQRQDGSIQVLLEEIDLLRKSLRAEQQLRQQLTLTVMQQNARIEEFLTIAASPTEAPEPLPLPSVYLPPTSSNEQFHQ
jgi:hypothetical protein